VFLRIISTFLKTHIQVEMLNMSSGKKLSEKEVEIGIGLTKQINTHWKKENVWIRILNARKMKEEPPNPNR